MGVGSNGCSASANRCGIGNSLYRHASRGVAPLAPGFVRKRLRRKVAVPAGVNGFVDALKWTRLVHLTHRPKIYFARRKSLAGLNLRRQRGRRSQEKAQ
jgi:hypothetical protein